MTKKALLISLLLSPLLAQDKILSTSLNALYNVFYLHNQDTLNTQRGDLKSYPLKDGFWLRENFTQQSSKPSSTLLSSTTQSLLTQLGYDHAFTPRGGKNFLGFSLGYAYSWIDFSSQKANANSFNLTLYDSYVANNHFYIDSSLSYTFILPSNLANNPLAHYFGANLEIGQKLIFSSIFFFQPLLKASVGFIPSLSLTSNSSTLTTQDSMPLFLKSGSYFGVDFFGSVKGDVRFGAFFDSDFFFFSSPKLNQNTISSRENYRLELEFATNIHASKNFRLYFGAKTSFFGESNIDYGANLGMRFLFGSPTYKQAPNRGYGGSDTRTMQSIQQNLRYEGDASIARVEERTHLTNEQVEEKYTTQAKRNSPNVQDDIKYAKRQRYLRESSRWIDIKKNEENYQNRNTPQMQVRDLSVIRDYHKRELERKYGKD